MKPDFSRLLAPKSIAVIGGRDAEAVIRQCQKFGFEGEIWPVNPKREELAGIPCYRSIAQLPGPPDAAFVAVHADAAIALTGGLRVSGAGGAIIYAAGFDEAGDAGGDRQTRLIEAAGDMPVLGPNCYGQVNAQRRVALWPDEHGLAACDKGIAFISQSGNIAINVSMQRRGLAIRQLVSLGNQAVITADQAIEALIDDPGITGFGLYIESVGDPERFAQAALRAHRAGKPIVAIKTGRTAAAAATVLSHTASLAGEDRVMDAFLQRIGIIRVDHPESLIETLKLLTNGGRLAGNRLITLSCSGGEAAIAADLGSRFDVKFDAIPEDRHEAIRAPLNDYVAIANPFDYHTFIWHDRARLLACFSAVLESRFDLALLIIDMPRDDRCETQSWRMPLDAFIEAVRITGARAGVVASLGELMPEELATELATHGITGFAGLERAFEATALASRPAQIIDPPLKFQERVKPARTLDEWRSKRWLQLHGLATPPGGLCHSVAEALSMAQSLGYPVVAKAASSDLAHKSEQNAVVINIADADKLATECERLLELAPALLIERMISGAVAEILLGAGRDALLGPYLVVASGGIMTEIIDDPKVLMLPLDEEEVDAALNSLQITPLLHGFRGRPKADVRTLKQDLYALEKAVLDGVTLIVELDINPLLVLSEGEGTVAADGLIRLGE